MADGDKITIDQINWDDSGLPKWATEETQKKIAVALGAMKKSDTKDSKEQEKQTKHLKDVVARIEQLNKNSSENSKKLVTQLNKKGGDYTKDLVKKNVSTPFKSVNMAVQRFAGKLGIAGAVIGGFAAAVGFVIGRLKQFSDSFRQVFAMGFRMEQGSLGLAKAAVAAEMGIAQYTELLGKFSTSVGIIGAKAFSDLNVQIRDNLQAQGMLGMSLAELTEYTGDFMDQLRTASMLGGKSNDQLEEMVVRYAQNITAFSQLANVSRDQIAAVIKGSTAVEAFTNKLNVLPAIVQDRVLRAAQTVTGMFAGLGTEFGDQLATTFTTAYGRGGLFFTEAGRELLAVNRKLYNSLSSLIDNIDSLDDQGAAKATSQLITEIANTSDAERERLSLIERSNTQFSGAARQQIALINQVQEIQKKGALEQYKDLQKLRRESQIDKLSVAFINFERVTAKLSVAFNKFFTELFGNDRILGAISGAMERITTMGIDLAKKLVENAGSIANKIANLVNRFMNFIGEFQGLTLGQAMIKALAAPLALMADMITGAIIKGMKLALPGFAGGAGTIHQANMSMGENQIRSLTGGGALANAGMFNESYLKRYSKEGRTRMSFDNDIVSGVQNELPPMLAKQFASMFPKGDIETGEVLQTRKGSFDAMLKKVNESGNQQLIDALRDILTQQAVTYLDVNKAQLDESIGYKTVGASGADIVASMNDSANNMSTNNKATSTDMLDPERLSQAKMRVMNQYLPMTGSSDPTKTSEGEFYSTSIRLLSAIASNTGGTKKAVDEVNGG